MPAAEGASRGQALSQPLTVPGVQPVQVGGVLGLQLGGVRGEGSGVRQPGGGGGSVEGTGSRGHLGRLVPEGGDRVLRVLCWKKTPTGTGGPVRLQVAATAQQVPGLQLPARCPRGG